MSIGIVQSTVDQPTTVSMMQKCKDWQGREVLDGQRYRPSKDDLCMECICNGGFRTQCSTASCALPPCRPYEIVPDACCEFTCLADESDSGSDFRNSTVYLMNDSLSTAGVRLVASTLTCVTVLLLIVFFMHKLRRHRRFLMHVPQVLQPSRPAVPYVCDDAAHGCIADPASSGVTVHYRQLHDEPPPPYVPPKGQQPLTFSGDVVGYAAPAYSVQQRCSHCPHACGHCTWRVSAAGTAACQCQDGAAAPVPVSATAMPAGHNKPVCAVHSAAAAAPGVACRPCFAPSTLAAETARAGSGAAAELPACAAQLPRCACSAEHSQPARPVSAVEAATALVGMAAGREPGAEFATRERDSSAELPPRVDGGGGIALMPVVPGDRLMSPATLACGELDVTAVPRCNSGGRLLLAINPGCEGVSSSSELLPSSAHSPVFHTGTFEPASPDSNYDEQSVDADRRHLLRFDSRECENAETA